MIDQHRNPWIDVLKACDVDSACIGYHQTQYWPSHATTELAQARVISETTFEESVACPECIDRIGHDVEWLESRQTGERVPLVCCPEVGVYRISLEWIRRWRIEKRAILEVLSAGLGIRGELQETVPHRLWQLGKVYWHGVPTILFFGLTLYRRDAPEVIAPIQHLKNAILLTPDRLSREPLRFPVVPLSLVMHWDGQEFQFDTGMLQAHVSVPEVKPKRSVLKRNANRAGVKDRLRSELTQHIRANRDHVQTAVEFGTEPKLLPFPTYEEWAERCGSSKPTICRCFQEDMELQQMRELAQDLYQLLGGRH